MYKIRIQRDHFETCYKWSKWSGLSVDVKTLSPKGSVRPVCQLSTLYNTLPHNLIKEKLINLIEWTFKREGSPYIACNEREAFFTSEDTKRYKLWSCQNVCEALIYLLDNIYIRFGTKLYRQIVGIPMGTN